MNEERKGLIKNWVINRLEWFKKIYGWNEEREFNCIVDVLFQYENSSQGWRDC